MSIPSFVEYYNLREAQEKREGGKPVPSPINLGAADNEFKPFIIKKDADESSYPNLAPVIDAFNKSGDIKLHRTMKGGEVNWQTMPKKKLYLVGGAVRDHLAGKTPKDLDLTTDATVDEIRLILSNAGFAEVESQGGKHRKGTRIDLMQPDQPKDPNKVFYVKGWDQKGNEFVVGAKVNGEEFEIATFREDSKSSDGRTPEEMKHSDISGDAARRDFNINAMYIELQNSDGPNNKLIDMFGGAHSLTKKKVEWVGKAEDRLSEDFLRALRYIRMVSRYGDPKTIGDDEIKKLAQIANKVQKVISKERIREEFLKGLEHPDVEPVEYINLYKKTGLLHAVFPGLDFETDAPSNFRMEKLQPLSIAWLLRNNDPNKVRSVLKSGKWKNEEVEDVVYLLSMLRMNPENAAAMRKSLLKGLPQGSRLRGNLGNRKMEKWWQMHGQDPAMMSAFMQYSKEQPIKGMVPHPMGQGMMINPALNKPGWETLDKPSEEMGRRLTQVEAEKFQSMLDKIKQGQQ